MKESRLRAGTRSRWLSIVGARPQFIKVAPLRNCIENHNRECRGVEIEHKLLHTGQHYDWEMAELLFEQLAIPRPDYNLGVGSHSFGVQLGRMLERLQPVIEFEKPDWVLVYGDTNSTLVGALVAARLGCRVTHIEAGCRSYRPDMPEEQNRVPTDHLSTLLLAPSMQAVRNLASEGIGGASDPVRRRVAFVGDLMFDALIANAAIADKCAGTILERHGLTPGRYYLLTIHRSENTDNPENLKAVMRAVQQADYPVLFPVHPRTATVLSKLDLPLGEKVRTVPPLGYLEMLSAERNARKILTDSGGVQKEAFYLKVPCITLRNETEWPETVAHLANTLVGADTQAIVAAIHQPSPQMAFSELPFGDGQASERIVTEILNYTLDITIATAKSA